MLTRLPNYFNITQWMIKLNLYSKKETNLLLVGIPLTRKLPPSFFIHCPEGYEYIVAYTA